MVIFVQEKQSLFQIANAKIKNNIALDTINAIITTPLFNIEFANLRLSAFL